MNTVVLRSILVVFALLPLPCEAVSQTVPMPSRPIHKITFERPTITRPNEGIITLFQDSRGFLWISSGYALLRYDGYTTLTFENDPNDPGSLPLGRVAYLAEDDSGMLWVGTDEAGAQGIARYDPLRNVFTLFSHNAADSTRRRTHSVSSLLISRDGSIWTGTIGNGLSCTDPRTGNVRTFLHSDSDTNTIAINRVKALAEGPDGRIWIGLLGGGLDVLDTSTGEVTHFKPDPADGKSLVSPFVTALHFSRNGDLWIGTYGAGVCRYDPSDNGFKRLSQQQEHPISSARVVSIMEDHAGRLWFGTLGSGVHVHDPASNAYAHFAADPASPDSLLSSIVLAMHEDMSFNVWLATGSGLNKVDLKPQKFSLWDPGPGRMLTPGAVTAIFEDSRENLWVGTETGLTCLPSNMSPALRYQHIPSDPRSLGEGTVTSILEHPPGMLWVGTLGGGLHKIDLSTGELHAFRHNDLDSSSLSSNNVSSLYVDLQGALWIGTSGGGLNMKMGDTGLFRSFPFSPRTERGLTNRVSHMLEDSRGNFWVAMVGRPLTLFHRASGNFEVIPSAPGNCNALAEDNKGNIWIATINGLYKMEVQTREVTDMAREGIFLREELKSMVLDTAGNIWLGWFGGLYRFTPSPASFPNQQYTVFDSTDGLPPGQFMHRATWRTRSGELLFGNAQGVVRFHPSSLMINMASPPIVITSVKVFEEPLPDASYLQSGSAIRLSHDRNLLSFQFASLDLTRPSKNKYLYTLEGFDNRWTYAEGHPTVRYTNLHPGEYVFRVRGANADGVWNEAGSSLALTILPPFWATWWFRAVAIIIAAAGLYGMHRYRVEQLLKMERIRTHIAMGLHDDVGADLTRITLFSNAARQRLGEAEKNDPQLLSLLGDITSISREAVDSMADIVWAVNPKNDSFDQLVIRMKTYAARLLEAHGIDYEVEFPESIASLRVPLEFRRNMFLIFKEALSNCVRHSKANTVHIGITREKDTLVMEIADNGKGFHKEHVRGNGLRNMQRRAEELHGRLEIVSGESQGTSVIFRAVP